MTGSALRARTSTGESDVPIYEYECPVCNTVKEELAKQGDPAPLCCTQMTRILSPTSFAFRTLGGNLARFSPSHGPVMKGNKRPVTIGNGHGLGGRRGRTPPKLGRKSYA
jgi:predicted nucleic acid-binding Zn ribbon protein